MLMFPSLLVAQRPIIKPVYPKVAWVMPAYAKVPEAGAGYYINKGFVEGAVIESKGRYLDPSPIADVDKALDGQGLPPYGTGDDWPEAKLRDAAKTLGARYLGYVKVLKLRSVNVTGYAIDGTLTVLDANGGFLLKAVPISTMPLAAPLKPKGILPSLKDEVPPTGVDTLGKQLARNAVVALVKAQSKSPLKG